MTSDEILQALSEIQDREPRTNEEAEISAARDWAKVQIFDLISDRPFDDPEELLFWFREEMWVYSALPTEIEKEINPFLVAKNLAEEVLLMFEGPREE